MSRTALASFGLALGLVACARPAEASWAPPVITRWWTEPDVRAEVGKFRVEEYPRGWRLERRLLHDGTLMAAQIPAPYLMPHDVPNVLGVLTPWDVLAQEGTLAAFDIRREPLSYHHRTGPVGAVFRELRTRKGGAEAKAPVGVVGLMGGEAAAYALPGQRVTFYERDPALKALVADSDKHFRYVAAARRLGAEIDVRVGDPRKTLAADAGRKYAVLLVEMYDTGFDPGDRLTLEAVWLYVNRVTPDGIVALHVSNKSLRLEPVAAQIAEEIGLAARVWHDDGDRRPGKTASSWVVLAKDKLTLGGLYSPLGDLAGKYGTGQLRYVVMGAYPKEVNDIQGILKSDTPKTDLVAWLKEKGDPESRLLAGLVERHGPYAALSDVMVVEVGHAFRPLELDEKVGLRRDGDKEWPAAARWPAKK